MSLEEYLLRVKIVPWLLGVIILLSVILITVTGINYDKNHCYELSIVYINGTTETIHCDHVDERTHRIVVDFERTIVLSNICEYSYRVIKCGCVILE